MTKLRTLRARVNKSKKLRVAEKSPHVEPTSNDLPKRKREWRVHLSKLFMMQTHGGQGGFEYYIIWAATRNAHMREVRV